MTHKTKALVAKMRRNVEFCELKWIDHRTFIKEYNNKMVTPYLLEQNCVINIIKYESKVGLGRLIRSNDRVLPNVSENDVVLSSKMTEKDVKENFYVLSIDESDFYWRSADNYVPHNALRINNELIQNRENCETPGFYFPSALYDKFDHFQYLQLKPTPTSLEKLSILTIRKNLHHNMKNLKQLQSYLHKKYENCELYESLKKVFDNIPYSDRIYYGDCIFGDERLMSTCGIYEMRQSYTCRREQNAVFRKVAKYFRHIYEGRVRQLDNIFTDDLECKDVRVRINEEKHRDASCFYITVEDITTKDPENDKGRNIEFEKVARIRNCVDNQDYYLQFSPFVDQTFHIEYIIIKDPSRSSMIKAKTSDSDKRLSEVSITKSDIDNSKNETVNAEFDTSLGNLESNTLEDKSNLDNRSQKSTSSKKEMSNIIDDQGQELTYSVNKDETKSKENMEKDNGKKSNEGSIKSEASSVVAYCINEETKYPDYESKEERLKVNSKEGSVKSLKSVVSTDLKSNNGEIELNQSEVRIETNEKEETKSNKSKESSLKDKSNEGSVKSFGRASGVESLSEHSSELRSNIEDNKSNKSETKSQTNEKEETNSKKSNEGSVKSLSKVFQDNEETKIIDLDSKSQKSVKEEKKSKEGSVNSDSKGGSDGSVKSLKIVTDDRKSNNEEIKSNKSDTRNVNEEANQKKSNETSVKSLNGGSVKSLGTLLADSKVKNEVSTSLEGEASTIERSDDKKSKVISIEQSGSGSDSSGSSKSVSISIKDLDSEELEVMCASTTIKTGSNKSMSSKFGGSAEKNYSKNKELTYADEKSVSKHSDESAQSRADSTLHNADVVSNVKTVDNISTDRSLAAISGINQLEVHQDVRQIDTKSNKSASLDTRQEQSSGRKSLFEQLCYTESNVRQMQNIHQLIAIFLPVLLAITFLAVFIKILHAYPDFAFATLLFGLFFQIFFFLKH